jgi:hypothetical protein
MGLRLEAEAATFCIINPTDLDSIWIKTNRVMSWLKKSDHRYRLIPGFWPDWLALICSNPAMGQPQKGPEQNGDAQSRDLTQWLQPAAATAPHLLLMTPNGHSHSEE